MDIFTAALIDEVRVQMAERNLRNKEMQERAGIDPSSWQRYFKTGARTPGVTVVRDVAAIFGMTTSELLALVEDRIKRSTPQDS